MVRLDVRLYSTVTWESLRILLLFYIVANVKQKLNLPMLSSLHREGLLHQFPQKKKIPKKLL